MPEVMFNGSVGRIEGRFHAGASPSSPLVLLLHPHPKQGGTMNNKIINMLFKNFVKRGFGALKFNYRGVGKSEGEYDNGEGELSDATSALDWLQSIIPNAESFWVVGYSYGALLGMQLLMRRPELKHFLSVSPPTNHYDFTFLAPCPVSGKIIQGSNDKYVNPKTVEALVNKLRMQKGINIDYSVIQGADHQFLDHMEELENCVDNYITQCFNTINSIAS